VFLLFLVRKGPLSQYWLLLPPPPLPVQPVSLLPTYTTIPPLQHQQMTLCLLVDKETFLRGHLSDTVSNAGNESTPSCSVNRNASVSETEERAEVQHYIEHALKQVSHIDHYNPLVFASGGLEHQQAKPAVDANKHTESKQYPQSQHRAACAPPDHPRNPEHRKEAGTSSLFRKKSQPSSRNGRNSGIDTVGGDNRHGKGKSDIPANAHKSTPKPLLLQVHLQQQKKQQAVQSSKSEKRSTNGENQDSTENQHYSRIDDCKETHNKRKKTRTNKLTTTASDSADPNAITTNNVKKANTSNKWGSGTESNNAFKQSSFLNQLATMQGLENVEESSDTSTSSSDIVFEL
jgi:hypothetical protein